MSATLTPECDPKRTGAALITITFAMDATIVNFSVDLCSLVESHIPEIMVKYRTPEMGLW